MLLTALPPSALAEAAASPTAFAQEVASEISAGNPPAWYTALPPSVQSYLQQSVATGSVGSVSLPSASISSVTIIAGNSTIVANGTIIPNGNSTIHTTRPATRPHGPPAHPTNAQESSAVASASAASASAASSSSSGGASMPTAIIGAGLAGAVGIVGLFAL